uniref:NADH dehydrogenase subunit 6 n=1 Tax=Tzotzilthelphusa villarosalensis TaxID=2761036 RepID=UPI00286BB76F|nr:NADH dehydrogenase subunit 6 [Tzotzilthelphusa villarosalensis]WKW91703.1 NADH dehydrogenase subunit 6 [Tzotzilthelphusa villarosalensis]
MLLTIPIMLTLSFLFTQLSHPLAMGMTLLLQTIMMSLTIGIFSYSFWFSYILFLIFLGGMLILFIYVASLASNEMFNFSLYVFTSLSMMLILMTMLSMLIDPISISSFSSMLTSSVNNHLSTPMTISWIYNYPSMMFTLFIILYLLLTLIIVIKIINMYKGPLRLL